MNTPKMLYLTIPGFNSEATLIGLTIIESIAAILQREIKKYKFVPKSSSAGYFIKLCLLYK